jgi:hypothetical protein
LSSIRTSLRTYPKLILTFAAAGSTAAVTVLALSGGPAVHPARTVPASGVPAGAVAAHQQTGRSADPAARAVTLDSAAISQVRAAQRTAQKMLARFGWGKRQWTPLDKLWNRESGWNKYAENPYSGAYGIPQALPGSKMASAGADWRSNATTQIRWGLRYIKSVYGRPRVAWDHELAYGWY